MVLQRRDVEAPSQLPRVVLLLRGVSDEGFELVARNDKLAMCSGCGGTFGDPFENIVIADRFFSFEHFGGSRETWFRVITFRLNLETRIWELTSDRSEVFDRLSEDLTPELVENQGNEGADFTSFDFERF